MPSLHFLITSCGLLLAAEDVEGDAAKQQAGRDSRQNRRYRIDQTDGAKHPITHVSIRAPMLTERSGPKMKEEASRIIATTESGDSNLRHISSL